MASSLEFPGECSPRAGVPLSPHSRLLRAVLCTSLSVPNLLLGGCSDTGTITQGTAPNLAKGNWQISSTDTAAIRLPVLSGELTSQADTISATLHSQSPSACVGPSTSFQLSGTFASDASTLAVTSWTSSGTCGPDTGVGSTMTRGSS